MDDGFWSEWRIDLLGRLWIDGTPTREIGRQLNCTRCAAIGKAWRLGLGRHPLCSCKFRHVPRAEPPWYEQLRAGGCRYDVGDNEFDFCGEPTREDSAFCPLHHSVVWVRMPKIMRKGAHA